MFFQSIPSRPNLQSPSQPEANVPSQTKVWVPELPWYPTCNMVPTPKEEKSGNLKPGMLTPWHPVNLEFVLGKHQFLCLNAWHLAISFWSTTKLEFIPVFVWPIRMLTQFGMKTYFWKEKEGKEGNRKGWRKGLERNKKKEKGTKRNRRKKQDCKAKAKARNLPNTKPNTDDFFDPKRVGDWGGLKSHYTLNYKPPCQVSPADGT